MDKATLDRMVVEYKELEEKANKLRTFITSGKIKESNIDQLNQDLLISQLKAMETYLCILSIRIGLNSNADKEESSIEEVKGE